MIRFIPATAIPERSEADKAPASVGYWWDRSQRLYVIQVLSGDGCASTRARRMFHVCPQGF